MKKVITLLLAINFYLLATAQTLIEIDLAKSHHLQQTIDLNKTGIFIKNKLLNTEYKISIEAKENIVPPFTVPLPQKSRFSEEEVKRCNNAKTDLSNIFGELNGEKSNEANIAKLLIKAENEINILKKIDSIKDCISLFEEEFKIIKSNTEVSYLFDFPLKSNQIITILIERLGENSAKYTYVYKTPEKNRWLVHYGLTYAPRALSNTANYFAFADTGIANRYTITKNNDNGPKPWDNISATINFTFPFHGDSRDVDGGFTAGFGLNAGLELSGHVGLSAIIGENIILSSGLAMLQRQKLRGEYKEGQIIKTNLNFEALHEKIWVPEIFFSIGFRFGSNPFAKKTTAPSTTPATTATTE